VTIPNSVTNIGYAAFQNCYAFTSITIPNSVTSIGDDAFLNCSSLTNVSLGNHVAIIGVGAFYGCQKLARITIPNSVTNVGYQAFGECLLLKSILFQGNILPDNDAFSYTTIIGYNFGKPIYGLARLNTTVYYSAGTTGWGATFGSESTVLWNPHASAPLVSGGQFSFGITGPANGVIVVEACVNLSNPVWSRVRTNTLSNIGTSTFIDPQSANFTSRYYRFGLP
jgi:hypothetical protein